MFMIIIHLIEQMKLQKKRELLSDMNISRGKVM